MLQGDWSKYISTVKIGAADIFKGRKIVIATMHKKEMVIAPIVEKFLGVQAMVPKNFDTDRFGTFTRDIERIGNQLETARIKLQTAMLQEKVDLGVSSEGSFEAHPSIPFIQSNLELILLIDNKNGLEIRGHYRTSETNIDGQYVKSVEEALSFARKIGFPEHGVIVRESENGKFGIHKNIQTEEELIKIVDAMLSSLFTKQAFVETDMRAHKNPTRMRAIEKATEDLIKNVLSLCPKCQIPGFVIIDFEKGLECSCCGIPTDLPKNDIYQCNKCGHEERRVVTKYGKTADPQYCRYCNP
jgi:hypothetical protein